MKKIIVLVVAIFCLFFIGQMISQEMGLDGFNLFGPISGKNAPNFTLPMTSGDQMSFEEFRDGREALIFFWATWCPHCRVQLKELQAQENLIRSNNVAVALVNVGEAPWEVTNFLDQNKIDLSVFLDESSEVSKQYNVVGLPTFFFISKDGVVLDISHELSEDWPSSF